MRFPKYRNQKVQHDGHSFASKLEAAVYQILKLREKAGEIEIVNHQDHVYLTQARINYIPDFRIFDHKLDDFVWVEAKGFETPEWRIKKKLWGYYGPGHLQIYRGSEKRPFLDETVTLRETELTIQCPSCNHKFNGGINDTHSSVENLGTP
jgi:hypothetical protein